MIIHNFMVSPSARYAHAICKHIEIFNKDYILLMDIL